jgi:acetyltransferase-like isoleucine patch superfamily enzyme
MMHLSDIPAEAATTTDLTRAGLLELGRECVVHPSAVFVPRDRLNTLRRIILGDRVTIGAHTVIHGGTSIAPGSHVGHGVVVGEPEYGYAVRQVHPGAGDVTSIGSGVVLRAGAIVYAAAVVGDDSTIGHNTLLRTGVTIGASSQLAANITVEKDTRIGSEVRCSPGSHLTAGTLVADRTFIGAGVRTVNDKYLIWRDQEREQPLAPPRFAYGCKVGSGSVILAGVSIGRFAVVGAGAVVTHDVEERAVVYGVPAVHHGFVSE